MKAVESSCEERQSVKPAILNFCQRGDIARRDDVQTHSIWDLEWLLRLIKKMLTKQWETNQSSSEIHHIVGHMEAGEKSYFMLKVAVLVSGVSEQTFRLLSMESRMEALQMRRLML